MPETNGEAPDNDNELAEAEDFRKKLDEKIAKADKIAETEKDERDKIEGKRIREYLEEVVPDWNSMNPTRLYKHIQRMFENAEQIRRFEIDLVWRRAIYIVPLIVIFFTAFGSLFYAIYSKSLHSFEMSALVFILFSISLINTFLSLCLAMINVEGRRWQRNWEYHVDYLQAILGLKMMQIYLRKETGIFTIGNTNIFISIFIFAVWLSISIGLLFHEFYYLEKHLLSYDTFWVVILLIIAVFPVMASIVGIYSFVFLFLRWFGRKFLGEKCVEVSEEMDVRLLQNLCFTPPSQSKTKSCGKSFFM